MIAEYAIRDAILADVVIAGLIGTRFYPHDAAPQSTADPAPTVLTYQRFDRDSPITLAGDELPSGPRIQFNSLAATAKAAKALGQELRRFFRGGYSGIGLQLVQLAGGGVLSRDPDSKLFGYRVDVLVVIDAAEAA